MSGQGQFQSKKPTATSTPVPQSALSPRPFTDPFYLQPKPSSESAATTAAEQAYLDRLLQRRANQAASPEADGSPNSPSLPLQRQPKDAEDASSANGWGYQQWRSVDTLAKLSRMLPGTPQPAYAKSIQAKPLQRQEKPEEEQSEETLQAKPLSSLVQREPLPEEEQEAVQTKLTVGAPGDQYEQEADQVAAQVMAMPEPSSPLLQKKAVEEAEEGEEDTEEVQAKSLVDSITPLVQRQAEDEQDDIQRSIAPTQDKSPETTDLESQLNHSKGGGNALPDEVRSHMEPRFGADFSQVRVHTDTSAIQMNKELKAQAFTHGSDIYFGAGKSPGQNDLTAHELTHVVQQTGAVQNKKDPDGIKASLQRSIDVQRASNGMPPKKGTTKINKKAATLTASGKTLTEAVTNLTSQGKGEAGSVTCKPERDFQFYQADDNSDEIVYQADILVTETKAMPVWTELNQQCEPVKKEWARFYSALDTHEDGHIQIDKRNFTNLHTKLLGKSTAEANKIFNDIVTKADTENNTYDATTKHGLTQGTGIKYVQCAPEKVYQSQNDLDTDAEIQTKRVISQPPSPSEATSAGDSQPIIHSQPSNNKNLPTVQMKCAACEAEEGQIQTKAIASTITPQSNKTVQKLPSWNDVKNTASAGAQWVGDEASAGAQWVGDKAGQAASMGKEAFAALVARVAPSLANLISQGPIGLLTDKIKEGIKGWLSGVVSGANIGNVVATLQGSFAQVFAGVQALGKSDPASCAAFTDSIQKLRDLGQAFMDNPVVKQVQSAFAKVSEVFQTVTSAIVAPVFDTLMNVAGDVFNSVKGLATTIWEWGAPVRNTLGAAWDWVKGQLGIGGDGSEGVLGWLKTKASEAWTTIKTAFAPVIEPLKKAGMVLLAFSPVGMFAAIAKVVPKLVQMGEWLLANKGDKDIVKKAHQEMGSTILPQLLEAVQSFSQGVQSTVTSLVSQVTQLSQSVLSLLGAISGVPLLSMARSLVQDLSENLQTLVTWGQTTFEAVAKSIQEASTKIAAKIKPYAGILSSLALAIVNPGMIPVILAGSAWQLLDDCYKAPIIDFLLDVVIDILQAAPSLPMFGLLWPMLKTGVLGFLQGMKAQPAATKVAVTNKLAKIISGGSPAFLLGFAKGLLKGIWEGLTDPFVLVYEGLKGLSNLVVWLNDTASQALVPEPAMQPAGVSATGAPSPAVEETGNQPRNAEMGQRMQQMAGELQPPAEQVAQGFMPAIQAAFSGGEGLTFEQLMQKLGDAWGAVENAIQEAGGTLASKVCEFMMQDGAEGEMGETVGWLAGTIAFEVALGILTAGSATAAKGAMKVLQTFAKVLDWTGEALGLAFKALAKVGGYVLDAVKGIGKLLSKAGGAAKTLLESLSTIGRKLMAFAEELLGLTKKAGKGAAGEVAEEALEKGAKETAETAAEKGAKEAVEAGAEKSAKEAVEAGAEKGAKEGVEAGAEKGTKEVGETAAEKGSKETATKAAEMPQALAEAVAISKSLEAAGMPIPAILAALMPIKSRYRWINTFEAEPKSGDQFAIFMIASKTLVTNVRARRRRYKEAAQRADSGGGHSYRDHGAHTNPDFHLNLLQSGKKEVSSKFSTHQMHSDAIQKAWGELYSDPKYRFKGNGVAKKKAAVALDMQGAGFSYKLDPSDPTKTKLIREKANHVCAIFKPDSLGKWQLVTMFPTRTPNLCN